jgi:hypothetical protein
MVDVEVLGVPSNEIDSLTQQELPVLDILFADYGSFFARVACVRELEVRNVKCVRCVLDIRQRRTRRALKVTHEWLIHRYESVTINVLIKRTLDKEFTDTQRLLKKVFVLGLEMLVNRLVSDLRDRVFAKLTQSSKNVRTLVEEILTPDKELF